MPYLVKSSITAQPRQYARVGIETDYHQKIISGTALMKHDSQDFWYPVTEFLGETACKKLRYLCEHCRAWIVSRSIDVGLKVKCPQCSKLSVVPDVQIRQLAALDRGLLTEAVSNIKFGLLVTALGIGCTVASYYDAIERSGPIYYIFGGIIVFGLGIFHRGVTQRSALKKKIPGK